MSNANFEYMDKASIDKDLNCEYCNNPLVDPVSTPCKHTFCRVCIENKIKKTAGACAKHKCKTKTLTLEDLTPVTERIVLNMLDRLLVKCCNCGAANIQRGSFEKHVTKQCPKATVTCSALDLKCPWTGPSDQVKIHVAMCVYEQIRPILIDIIQENRLLKDQVQQMAEQCTKTHSGQIKDLQESNQRLTETLNQEKNLLRELQIEVQQLKDLFMQERHHITELQTETQREKAEITRVDERCNKHEIQLNHLNDKISVKGDIFGYQNSLLEFSISKCQARTTVDLSKQQLLDRDMETIVKQALIEKECTRLDLGYNAITAKGAAIIADALKQNTTLEELDFHNNRVSDLGVHSLAEVLSSNSTTVLKALGLGSNGITDKGAEHLAEMLKTNRSITWLALAGNQIGDRGVQLLANTLAHHNTSLLVLSLHVNKAISDTSVDAIIDMLQKNKSLKKLWMQDCNITEEGKSKLRDAAKSKPGFFLYL